MRNWFSESIHTGTIDDARVGMVSLARREKIVLTSGDDVFTGGKHDEVILALRGNDSVEGVQGDDTVRGGRGDDFLGGGRGSDRIQGGGGDDEILGDSGRDELIGGNGNDSLRGGGGGDVFQGGLGADQITVNHADPDGHRDVVVYTSVEESLANNADRLDFIQPGEDKIDLSAIDADVTTPENDAFHFIGKADFSGVAGELHCDGSRIYADVDGDGAPDFEIDIGSYASGAADILHARDFVL